MSGLFNDIVESNMLYYQKPPLCFQGNKKNVINYLGELIKIYKRFMESNSLKQKDIIFLDCFGGSGLLSHFFKYHFRNSQVIWNDFDNYQKRLDNIPLTNEIASKLKPILDKYKTCEALSDSDKNTIIEILESLIHKKI